MTRCTICNLKSEANSWRGGESHSSGVAIATASLKANNMTIHLLRRDGSVYNSHNLGIGRCLWLEWDCKGLCLGMLQEVCDPTDATQQMPPNRCHPTEAAALPSATDAAALPSPTESGGPLRACSAAWRSHDLVARFS